MRQTTKLGAPLPQSAEVLPYLVGFGDGSSWLVGRRATRESNAATVRNASLASGTDKTEVDCGTAGTDGSPSGCFCTTEPKWIMAPSPAIEKLVNRTCFITLPDGTIDSCTYKVVRSCS